MLYLSIVIFCSNFKISTSIFEISVNFTQQSSAVETPQKKKSNNIYEEYINFHLLTTSVNAKYYY